MARKERSPFSSIGTALKAEEALGGAPTHGVGQRFIDRREMLLQVGDGAGIGAVVVGVVGAPEHAAIDADLFQTRQTVRLVRFDRDEALLAEQLARLAL